MPLAKISKSQRIPQPSSYNKITRIMKVIGFTLVPSTNCFTDLSSIILAIDSLETSGGKKEWVTLKNDRHIILQLTVEQLHDVDDETRLPYSISSSTLILDDDAQIQTPPIVQLSGQK